MVAGCLIGCVVVFVVDNFMFLFWWTRSERGIRERREKAIFLQFFHFQLHPVLSALDFLHSVIHVNKRCVGVHAVKHPLSCAYMAKMSFLGAVVAVGRRSAVGCSWWLHGRAGFGCDVVLSPDLWTSIKKVSCLIAAMALLVPVRPVTAGAEEVSRQATVIAVFVGTFTGYVARRTTKEARRHLFRIRAVLGEMSSLAAIPAVHVFVSVVSVWQPLDCYPGTPAFVVDLSCFISV